MTGAVAVVVVPVWPDDPLLCECDPPLPASAECEVLPLCACDDDELPDDPPPLDPPLPAGDPDDGAGAPPEDGLLLAL
jgi:hypothetical protein